MTSKASRQPLLTRLDRAKDRSETADRRRVRTRAALLEAAQRLFAAKPLDSVSIEDITEEADVAKGSFYNHFTDKGELAEEIAGLIRAHVADLIDKDESNTDDPSLRLGRAAFILMRFSLEHPESSAALTRLTPALLSPDAVLNARAILAVEKGLASGTFKGMSAEQGALLVIGVSIVLQEKALQLRDAPDQAVDMAKALVAAQLRAFGVNPRRAASLARQAADSVLAGMVTSVHKYR